MKAAALTLALIVCAVVPASAQALIAYRRSSTGEIVVARNDGAMPRVVAHGVGPSISPNGRLLAYLTRPRHHHEGFTDDTLRVLDLATGRSRLLTREVYSVGVNTLEGPPVWSPNSRYIVVGSDAARRKSRFGIGLNGGLLVDVQARRVKSFSASGRVVGATFAPTSLSFVYDDDGCVRQGDRLACFVMRLRSVQGGRARLVGSGVSAAWGRKTYAFARRSGIWAAPAPGRRSRKLLAGHYLSPIGWSANGDRLLAATSNSTYTAFTAVLVNGRTGGTRRLPTLFSVVAGISRDGRSVLGQANGDVITERQDGTVSTIASDAQSPTWTG